ncbi:chemotaxis response regulator protein-glutamate methylesterase [Pontibacillus salicampi]|uniref:Protein-glutamate methylesterase/protein-glutamine glutaminase n=1 Tax=Pontibacillus salicampi TaxID=1449801 RepID=A0ABV6LPI6_9BACI
MNQVNVLVVDDSAFMRKMVSEMLQSHEQIHVIATARNGEDGLKKMREYKPDVMTLDVEMPVMGGLTCLEQIMHEYPIPVLMLSSVTSEGASSTIKAMELGAVDFIQKPSGAISLDIEKIKTDIVNKVLAAATANLQEVKPSTRHEAPPIRSSLRKNVTNGGARRQKQIIAIGTSTGGPRALQHVLSHLPDNIEAPILVVQHMPPGFTQSLAKRLDTLCAIEVKEAEDKEILRNGVAYIAPGDFHLQVEETASSAKVHLHQEPPVHGHRPSVDVLFQSVSTLQHYQPTAIVMTGMGSDGALGLRQLKAAVPTTIAIAESSQSAVVYGMPKACVATNLVDYEIHLKDISATLWSVMGNRRGENTWK